MEKMSLCVMPHNGGEGPSLLLSILFIAPYDNRKEREENYIPTVLTVFYVWLM